MINYVFKGTNDKRNYVDIFVGKKSASFAWVFIDNEKLKMNKRTLMPEWTMTWQRLDIVHSGLGFNVCGLLNYENY